MTTKLVILVLIYSCLASAQSTVPRISVDTVAARTTYINMRDSTRFLQQTQFKFISHPTAQFGYANLYAGLDSIPYWQTKGYRHNLDSVTTVTNLAGLGIGVYKSRSGVAEQLKRLKNIYGFIITDMTDSIGFAADTSLLQTRATAFRWSKTGSSPVTDSLRFITNAPVIQTQSGNTLTTSVDTSTLGTGLTTLYQNSLKANKSTTLSAGTAISSTGLGDLSANRTINADTTFYATATKSGFLKYLDWTTFNGKLDSIANVAGTGVGIYKTGSRDSLKRLVAGTNITLTDQGDSILIDASSGASGNSGLKTVFLSAPFNVTSATLADAPGLSVNVVADSTYAFYATLFVDPHVSDGWKVAISGTATEAYCYYDVIAYDNSAVAITDVTRATALNFAVEDMGPTTMFITIQGVISVASSGTLTVQFATSTGAGGTSSMLIGSFAISQPASNGGTGTLVVEETDQTPSIANVDTLQFNNGYFIVTNPSGARAVVALDTSTLGTGVTTLYKNSLKLNSSDTTIERGYSNSLYLKNADSTTERAYSNSLYLKNADSTTERTYSNSLYLKNADSTTERTYSNSLYLKNADSTTERNYSNSLYLKNADSTTERTYSNSIYLKNADSTTLKNSLLKNADSTTERTYSNSLYLKNADSTTERTYSNSLYLKNADSTTERTYSNSLYPAKTTTITIAGTSNQITSSAGAQDLSANRTWTLSTPQDIATGSTPQFLRLGLGQAAPAGDPLGITKNQNAMTQMLILNSTAGASSEADVTVQSNGAPVTKYGRYSTSTTAYGAIAANMGYMYDNGNVGMVFMADNASGIIKFATGGNTERARFSTGGNFGIGNLAPGDLFAVGANKFAVNSSGTIDTLGGIKTEGLFGASAIVDTVRWTGQTATIAAQNLNNTAVNGTYSVSAYLYPTTAGTSGSVTATISWNDGAAETAVTGTHTFGALGTPVFINGQIIVVTNSTAITWLTTVTAAAGSPVYVIIVVAQRLF